MINLFNNNYNKIKTKQKKTKKTKKVNKKNSNSSSSSSSSSSSLSSSNNSLNLNNLKNLNKKSFIKKIKYSAKQKAKLKKYKPRSVESYCKAFHKVDILGKVNKNLYQSCKTHKYCRKNKCHKIDEKNNKELTKRFGKKYNMYIQGHLREKCPLTVNPKNIKLCEKKTLKQFYETYGISDIYNKLNECDTKTCAKEKKVFYTNLFRTKQLKLKKKQRLLLALEKEKEEPDMYLIKNGDL